MNTKHDNIKQQFHNMWNEMAGTGLLFDEKLATLADWHIAQLEAAKAEALDEPNQLLRSAYQVAKREGRATNWKAFRKQLDDELKREHEIMHPMANLTKQQEE